jgi:uncharacterized protein (TIGR00730 family)
MSVFIVNALPYTPHRNTHSITALGTALAKASRPLIYGGGKLGLMGAVAQATLDNGGHVTGVSPYAMVARGGEGSKTAAAAAAVTNGTDQTNFVDKVSDREPPPHPNRVSIVVGSMHERKTLLAKMADGGFVALPGGYGTLEEVSGCETDKPLGLKKVPVASGNYHVVTAGDSC